MSRTGRDVARERARDIAYGAPGLYDDDGTLNENAISQPMGGPGIAGYTTGGGAYGYAPNTRASTVGAVDIATDPNFGNPEAFGAIGSRSIGRDRNRGGMLGASYGARAADEDLGMPAFSGGYYDAGRFSPGSALADAFGDMFGPSNVASHAAPDLAPSGRIAGFATPGLAGSAIARGPAPPSRNPNMAMRGGMPGPPSAKPSGFARLDGMYGRPTRTAAYSPTSRLGGPRATPNRQQIAAALSAPVARTDPFGAGGWAAQAFGMNDGLPGAGPSGGGYAAGGFGSGASQGAQSEPQNDPFSDGGWASDAFGW